MRSDQRELAEGVIEIGAADPDRRIFDEVIPLPDGTTYNCYLIRGSDKTALIDTVDPTKTDVLLKNLENQKAKKIDYIIANHAEQDHSGAIPKILEIYPDAKVICSEKCKPMIRDMLLVPDDRIIAIKDGERIELGGKTLRFVYTPWVHWPETMATYLEEDKILFSCDFFGSHYAGTGLYVKDEKTIYKAAKRYYAEIMMPFRQAIKANIEKQKQIEIKVIAPSHGPIHDRPELIINAYKDWISDDVKNEVVLPYVSMHGSTKAIVEYFEKALQQKGVVVKKFDLTNADIGDLAIDLVDAATVVIGSPTFLTGPHPAAVYAAYLANCLRPKTKFASIIGSYGWAGKMVEQIAGMLGNLKVEIIPPVMVKGYPKQSDFEALDRLADDIAKRHESFAAMEPKEAYKIAIEMEVEGRNAYLQEAKKTKNFVIKQVFSYLADQELKHIEMIRKIAANEAIEMDPNPLNTAKKWFEGLMKDIDESALDRIDYTDVFGIGINFEKKAHDFYVERAKEAKEEIVKRFFLRLAREEDAHFALLENARIDIANQGRSAEQTNDWFYRYESEF